MADDKIVCVKLIQAMGEGNEEGKILHLPESVAQNLVDSGMAEMANNEEVNGGEAPEEEVMEESPMVANSIAKLGKNIEKAVSDATGKAISKIRVNTPNIAPIPTMETKGKKEVLYKTVGHYARGIGLAINGNRNEQEKVYEYQRQAAEAWKEKGWDNPKDTVVKAFGEKDLKQKSILGINETTNSTGGFLVNPQFSENVYNIPHNQIDLLGMTMIEDAKSNVLNQRYILETSLANGSIFGGLNMVATSEGASFTSSLPAWANIALTLQKNSIFVYYTNEVLEDASYPVESEVNEYVSNAFLYGLNTASIQGFSGIEGLLHNPGLVTITSSSNDTAFHTTPQTCLTWADISAIWSAVYPNSQVSEGGVWLFHPGLQQAITSMTYTFSGSAPAWGLQFDGQDGLKGRGPLTPYYLQGKPAYPCWAMSAPGTAGDIGYFDMKTVKTFRKPYRVEASKDFQFGTDQVAMRFVDRCDIKGLFRNAVTGPTGSSSFSAYCTRSSVGT